MRLEQKILAALRLEIKKAEGKSNLAAQRKTAYSIVNRFENGQCKIRNMTISTLEKLFPQIELIFFPEDKSNIIDAPSKSDDSVSERFSLERDKVILEKDRQIFELEKENWRLKRELEEAKNDVTTRLFGR